MTHHRSLDTGTPVRLRLLTPPTFWRCEPGWSWVSRPLPDHLLWCVLDGIGRIELDGRTRDLAPGTCAVFAPGDAPRAQHDPRRRLLVFGMHFEPDGDGPASVVPEVRWGDVPDRVLLGALAKACDAAYRRQDAAGGQDRLGLRQAELCLEQILCSIWEAAHRSGQSASDAAIDEVAQLIRQDPGRDWSVAEMAAAAALSRAQFTRRFVAQHGRSPAQYLIQARIDRAHQLLTESGMTVTRTAAALGYTDVPYFSRQYKQRTGRLPSEDRAG
ncbi:transcriptional regulator, AraC family [Kribbella flavida DSM 17836]|uniref:Transcriptional regulator, AraC family n=1 Tax=Kribbella flavida (strain DSM 17836 / JCM 10339 / NBRC 14399) TaxID=479435 RepID=D2PRH8_KRIFD|nr:AraC family transcriptional regulator [Kribbella flavida]ADB34896.1 transcriptional regulator, AraC family [Kribbella flavida DSM 17836]